MEKSPRKCLPPGDSVYWAKAFPDDHHQSSRFAPCATVDIGKVRILPVTAEPPPSVLKKKNIEVLGAHPLPQNVKLIGAQGANVPAEAREAIFPDFGRWGHVEFLPVVVTLVGQRCW